MSNMLTFVLGYCYLGIKKKRGKNITSLYTQRLRGIEAIICKTSTEIFLLIGGILQWTSKRQSEYVFYDLWIQQEVERPRSRT